MALSLKLKIDVLNEEMIVWLPGTLLAMTYERSSGIGIAAKSGCACDDRDAPITLKEFRAMAWKAAQEKARKLGWIF